MMDLEMLQQAKTYMEKMANGVNPITGIPASDYDLINDVRISRSLFFVSDVLRQVIENGGEIGASSRGKKQPFSISQEQLQRFEISINPITASEITRRINALVDQENMAKLKNNSIAKFLTEAGMLKTVETADGAQKRVPSDYGLTIGISTEERISKDGKGYSVVIYNEEAQRFILDNFDGVLAVNNTPSPGKANQGKPWTDEQDKELTELFKSGLSLYQIAKKMQRTQFGIERRLEKLGLSGSKI